MGLRYYGGRAMLVRDGVTKDPAGLTIAQRALLVAIAELRVELRGCPSYRQVCERADLKSTNDVSERIKRLVRIGYVRETFGEKRTLQPTDLGWRISGVNSEGIADPRVEGGHRCYRCSAITFKPHRLETCDQLLSGKTFAEQASA